MKWSIRHTESSESWNKELDVKTFPVSAVRKNESRIKL